MYMYVLFLEGVGGGNHTAGDDQNLKRIKTPCVPN